MEGLIVPIGVPVTIVVVLMVIACVVAMAFSWGTKYPKVVEYRIDQHWDHEPLLFSATGIEPMTVGHHTQTGDEEGASASGKW